MVSQRKDTIERLLLFFLLHTVKSQECFPVLGGTKVILEVGQSRRNHVVLPAQATVVPVSIHSILFDCDMIQVWQLFPPTQKKIKTENIGEVSWSPVVIK